MKKTICFILTVLLIAVCFYPPALAEELITIDAANVLEGFVGQPFSVKLGASGGTAPYTFEVSKLPAGLSFDTKTNSIIGVPIRQDKRYIDIAITDAKKSRAVKKVELIIYANAKGVLIWEDNTTIGLKGLAGNSVSAPANLNLKNENGTPATLVSLSFSDVNMSIAGNMIIYYIPAGQKPGIYTITITASKDGYINATRNVIVEVIEAESVDKWVPGVIIDGGERHSLCVMENGDVYAWGDNSFGELGDKTNLKKPVLQKVSGIKAPAISVAAGGYHSMALITGGDIYTWGRNSNGQLGDGTLVNRNTAAKINIPSDTGKWIAIDAGGSHSLGLLSNGVVYAWGNNDMGQLGDATLVAKGVPTKVRLQVSMGKAVAVAAGAQHSLALMDNGSVYAWGRNYEGQLGNGETGKSDRPVKVKLPASLKAVAITAGENHSLALMSDGSIYAWGRNVEGQLGDVANDTLKKTPVKVTLPEGVTASAISAGRRHSIALTSDGAVFTWGWNRYGQLGNYEEKNHNKPIKLTLPVGRGLAMVVAAGWHHNILLMGDGALFAWGSNEFGQLGTESTKDSFFPTRMYQRQSQIVAMPK